MFGQMLDCDEGVSYTCIWEKFSKQMDNQCKGPEKMPAEVTREQQGPMGLGFMEHGEVTDELREAVVGWVSYHVGSHQPL